MHNAVFFFCHAKFQLTALTKNLLFVLTKKDRVFTNGPLYLKVLKKGSSLGQNLVFRIISSPSVLSRRTQQMNCYFVCVTLYNGGELSRNTR